MNPKACIEEVLKRGLDDWVHAAELAYVAKSAGGATTDAEIRDVSMEIVREVIKEGLMEVGDVTPQGFNRWGLSVDEALKRIEHAWSGLGRRPQPGDICWLSNTKKGDDIARQLDDSNSDDE